MKKCIICGCGQDEVKALHKFPQPEEKTKQWCIALGMAFLGSVPSSHTICSRHFEDSCYRHSQSKFLNRGAVPTLHTIPPRPAAQELEPGITPLSLTSVLDPLPLEDRDFPTTEESTHQLTTDFAKNDSCTNEDHTKKATSETPISSEMSQTFTFLSEVPSRVEDEGRKIDDIQSLLDILEGEEPNSVIEETALNTLETLETPETPEAEISIFEKPYFTTVKSYLKDKNCFTDVCRICFSSISDEHVVLLLNNSSTPNEFRSMLKVVLPDLDLDIYQITAFCQKCVQVVENSYELREKWLLTEEKLQKIIERKKNDRDSKSDLVIMMKSSEDDEIESVKNRNADSEAKFEDNSNILHSPHEAVNQPNPTKKIWGSGPYICDSCGDVSTKLRLFKIHLAKHKEQHNETDQNQQTICEICGELFTNRIEYKEHFIKHVELRNKCRICKEVFRNRRRLNIHIKHYHLSRLKKVRSKNSNNQRRKPSSRKYYLCHLCNKQFLFTWYLEQHLRVHYNKLECEYCGKLIKFGNSSKMSQESRTICL